LALSEWQEKHKSDEDLVEEDKGREKDKQLQGIPENEPGSPTAGPMSSQPGAEAPKRSVTSSLAELKGLDELESEIIRQRIDELRKNQEHEIEVMRREHNLEMQRLIQYEKERLVAVCVSPLFFLGHGHSISNNC